MATSVKLPGGAKVNISKKGVGASINKKGFGVGFGPNGGRVRASIPGTGISWSESITMKKLINLKDAFFGSKKKEEEPVLNKEVEIQAEKICSMCGAKVSVVRTKEAMAEFKEFGTCQKCQDILNA